MHVTGLRGACEYEVRLDGEKVWPEADSPFPPSVIRPIQHGETLTLAFGSCRISAPHEPPYTSDYDEDERGLGIDALYATAMDLKDGPPEELPHVLVLLGDQIYSHKPPFDTLRFIEERRDTAEPPGGVVANFEEYARIYRDAWSDPAVRWLLSTVPSAMIFDDHEVGDDWNVSEAWVEEMRQHPTWNDQIVGGYASYWIYQHLGNLRPEEISKDDLYNRVKASEDAWPVLRDFAYNAHRGPDGLRWSYHRDLGNTRLLMIDSRGGRILDENRRSTVDDEEWAWVSEKATGGFDHWASFHDSFAAMVRLIGDLAGGERGAPPSTVLILSGDVHHGYLAEATLENRTKSRVYQAVCSPLRNALPGKKSFLQNHAWTKLASLTTRLLARLAGVPREPLTWRMTHDAAFFENQIATLELEDGSATITFEKAVLDASKEPSLEKLYRHRLA